jgi:hypothetical protein
MKKTIDGKRLFRNKIYISELERDFGMKISFLRQFSFILRIAPPQRLRFVKAMHLHQAVIDKKMWNIFESIDFIRAALFCKLKPSGAAANVRKGNR